MRGLRLDANKRVAWYIAAAVQRSGFVKLQAPRSLHSPFAISLQRRESRAHSLQDLLPIHEFRDDLEGLGDLATAISRQLLAHFRVHLHNARVELPDLQGTRRAMRECKRSHDEANDVN